METLPKNEIKNRTTTNVGCLGMRENTDQKNSEYRYLKRINFRAY